MLVTEVINLPKMLPEIGKIKIGNKGETRKSKAGNDYRLPQKLDHFIITTNEKDGNDDFIIDSEIHAIIGDQPKELPIRLLFNDLKLNFITRYAIYKGKDKCICEGDGVTFYWLDEKTNEWKAGRVPVEEMKSDFKGDKCKINGVLSCVIEGVNKIGGVWKFRTVGINSVIALKTGLEFIQQLTGGQLAGIPLTLVLRPKTVNVEGKSTKVYVVNVEYRGTIEDLQETAYKILTSRSVFSHKLLQVEQQAIKQLAEMPNAFDEDVAETVAEFYPTQQEGYKEVEHDDLSDLDDTLAETAEIKKDEMPKAEITEDLSGIPDLTLPEETIVNEDDTKVKIAKMRIDAIAKVNEADTIAKLETLKKGIGYKDDFGKFKAEADAVIIDVLAIINNKIVELTPKPEPKTAETTDPHEKLKNDLIKHGLDHDLLRQDFYKNYAVFCKEFENSDMSEAIMNKLKEIVADYKNRKINGKKAGLITKINEKLADLKNVYSDDIYKALADTYKEIKKDDFAGLWKFWLNLTE